jgi:hypothetical protein
MKTLLLSLALLAASALGAFAQAGSIGVFRDPGGSDCHLGDKTAGVTSFYIVHVGVTGAMGSQYAAPKPPCFTATYLSDANVFPVTIGNSQSGVSIGYGTCRSSPIHLQTISFFTQALTQPCCRYFVVAHPGAESGDIEMVDCLDTILAASSVIAVVNGSDTCPCGGPPKDVSSWGKVKTLYTEE